MTAAATQCACCQMPISDPTTRVVEAGKTFCCPNCAAAMQRSSSGAAAPAGVPSCVECGVPIVDRSTMQTRVGENFCCANCLNAVESFDEPPPGAGTSGARPAAG